MLTRGNRRTGFTLVEMIVVITIIAFLAALTALYFPRYQDRELVSRGADALQGWLLIAKQQARRDGLPTGLRLYVTQLPGFNNGNKFVRKISYIQQPEDVAQGLYVGKWDPSNSNTACAFFSLPSGITFGTDQMPVARGDYLELYGGGAVHRIDAVYPNSLELPRNTATLTGPTAQNPLPNGWPSLYTNNEPVNYRIIRQPAPIPGEQLLSMPPLGDLDLTNSVNVCIDFASNRTTNVKTHMTVAGSIALVTDSPPGARSSGSTVTIRTTKAHNLEVGQTVKISSVTVDGYNGTYTITSVSSSTSGGPVDTFTYTHPFMTDMTNSGGGTVSVEVCEILFSPSGALMGPDTSNAQVILWVRDGMRDNSTDVLAGHGTLITVQPRTGFIAAHPASSGSDAYEFTKDARSSGM